MKPSEQFWHQGKPESCKCISERIYGYQQNQKKYFEQWKETTFYSWYSVTDQGNSETYMTKTTMEWPRPFWGFMRTGHKRTNPVVVMMAAVVHRIWSLISESRKDTRKLQFFFYLDLAWDSMGSCASVQKYSKPALWICIPHHLILLFDRDDEEQGCDIATYHPVMFHRIWIVLYREIWPQILMRCVLYIVTCLNDYRRGLDW
jgi:hypothetical protein